MLAGTHQHESEIELNAWETYGVFKRKFFIGGHEQHTHTLLSTESAIQRRCLGLAH